MEMNYSLLARVTRTALITTAVSAFSFGLTACSDTDDNVAQASHDALNAAPHEQKHDADTGSHYLSHINVKPDVVIKVGYANQKGEPLDLGMLRWKEELEERSHGTMTLELYPAEQLGTKDELLERIAKGENIATIADGSNFYDIGAYELGITFAPYLFKNYDEAYNLTDSQWYKDRAEALGEDLGIHVLSSKWSYGLRHVLSTKKIESYNQFKGLKIRTAGNDVQQKTWENYGAIPVDISLARANEAFKQGTLDAVEQPIATIYGSGLYKNAKYLLTTGHVHAITNIVVSDEFMHHLTQEQQQILTESCDRAAAFYNVVQKANEYSAMKAMKEQGLIVTTPSQFFLTQMGDQAEHFYHMAVFKDKWSQKLIDLAKEEKQVPISYYTGYELHPENNQAYNNHTSAKVITD